MNRNKSMIIMMLACLGAILLPHLFPADLSGGIGLVLLVVILFACCIPMIKMVTGINKDS